MARTLVKTTTAGWYIDADDPDGSRTRKHDEDVVLELADVERKGDKLVPRAPEAPEAEAAHSNGGKKAERAERPEPQTTIAETGKILVGKTLQIKCQWKGCSNTRTIKPQDAFQVRYCVEHQEQHRKDIQRAKRRAKTEARRREREAAKAVK